MMGRVSPTPFVAAAQSPNAEEVPRAVGPGHLLVRVLVVRYGATSVRVVT
jgi:hypothetical protein